MRSSLIRLAALVAGIAVVVSCDAGPITPRFGNGIAGGTSGTAPIVPPNPNSPDTSRPFVRIDTPATTGQLVNVGDSILVVTRAIDDRQLTLVQVQGMKYTGDPNLGTLVEIIRFPTIQAPVSGGLPFRVGLQDTIIRRFLKPAVPLDSTVDSLVILAIATDQSGNVDTARRRVNLVTGPAVTLLAPVAGDSVPQNVAMSVSARVTHNAGVRIVRLRVQGETTWPVSAALDTTITDTIIGTQRDVTVSHTVVIPATAPPGGRVTITASAVDITSNPGSAPPIVVFVREFGTTAPRVTQIIPPRLEIVDSVTVLATGDGITRLGFTIRDSTGAVIKDSSVATAITSSNARADIGIDLLPTHQGKRVRISTYAVDLANVTGFSVTSAAIAPQTSAALAHLDSAIIVFGKSYRLPRPGTVGDMQVDTVRSNVIISNMDANRLEVWRNPLKQFDTIGVAVGSQPWGLAVSMHPDTLLVANSGGTNISRVFLGNPATGDPRTILEDLPQRIRTRTNFMYTVAEGFDAGGFVHFSLAAPTMFSDRPQYIGQTRDRMIYFSTKPTPVAPEGTVRYLDPSQAFPDMRTFVFVRNINPTIEKFVFIDLDSVLVSNVGTGIPDTIFLYDHLPGTNQNSIEVRAPICNWSGTPAPVGSNIDDCDPLLGAADPNADSRFPNGMGQGAKNALRLLHSHGTGGCVLISALPTQTPSSTCSDSYVVENQTPVGITDTTFVAVSADRNWIAFGEGNTSPGFVMMAQAIPFFFSPLVTQKDLTNNASERVFGLAIDSTGLTVGAHGAQSFYSAVDNPFHLRLQGIYGDAGTGGAGIAYHPRANGTASPVDERLSFVAAGDRTIHAVDVAFFIRRGRYELKHQLYGPLRVTRRLAGDDPTIVLKLYGISIAGGLTVIDLRASDILPVP